jgi:hypothetical protein
MATAAFPIDIRIPQKNFANSRGATFSEFLAVVPAGAIISFEVGGNNSRNFRTMSTFPNSPPTISSLGN